MFYETQHFLCTDEIKMEQGTDFNFPPHLHASFELIVVTAGEMTVTVDKKQYFAHTGDALLIFPHQVHALDTPVHSSHSLCIFSPQLVQAYSKVFLASLPESNLFRPTSFYVDSLCALAADANTLQIKGVLYALCGEFDAGAAYVPRKADRDALIDKIFRFVETDFGGDCSLSALAAATAYHYVYLSRYFKACTGISFTDYVNHYRVNEACYILKNTTRSVLQTALDCGFDSLRSFNRNFKRIMGVTPQEYRGA
ncbi:MAG: AraC family transcriptional regulator [Clostridia bacterium]|nr:AraC family transcriptional regulator [Clostridia bacterium]